MQELLSPDVLEALSQLLLDLYAACDLLPFQDFQREALLLIQAKLPFDSALWAAGTFQPVQGPTIFSIYLYNQPQEMLSSYEQVKGQDQAFLQAFTQPGKTLNIALTDLDWQEGSEAMKAHAERYGMQHTLTTVTLGAVTELIGAIVLYRADPANPFSEQERLLQQNVVPHLIALYNRSRISHLQELLHPGQERRQRAAALVDHKGFLYNANPSFVQFMLKQWPDWHGPLLPRALIDNLIADDVERICFSHIVVHVTKVNDLLLLHLRDIGLCDGLSQREWDVAVAFGNGMSHKEVARQLGIAPGTVRNHLSTIYEKLGISNKAELVHSLKMAPR
jgi:DNA-binding CsgD family transcriptional regulator